MKKKFLKLFIATILVGGVTATSTTAYASSLKAKSSVENKAEYNTLFAQNDVTENGKYTVSVEVLKDQSEELSMAGQYINKKAFVEVNGSEKYMTLKFTKIEWMQNIKILVNDSEVAYDKIEEHDENQTATIRFKIPDINANIKFSMNVVPMGNARVAFRIVQQNDLTKLEDNASKESVLGVSAKNQSTNNQSGQQSNVNKDGKELPQTGYPIGQEAVLAIGGLTTIAGIALKKRK